MIKVKIIQLEKMIKVNSDGQLTKKKIQKIHTKIKDD